ncbi:hypothetical protein BU25DRAFT_460206 [Macroventuria anomochaeta]|uniref:Uncharacterized protein n=1 Tax=Macroventuria anomochaeta TaxID=301207 RepID=A0ACB6RU17_9PLEO|nr:uncharacterized protein BU25DRAFT_460206 [Macroventuria anomochaeta]KAF2625470.1 hypothetical protein BU25DRAFT_460206 [Macroventuria anomochaeta]
MPTQIKVGDWGGWRLWYNSLRNASPGNGQRLGGLSGTPSRGQSEYCYALYPICDHHMIFECRNLKNYKAVAEQVRNHHSLTIKDLCTFPIYSRLSPWKDIGFAVRDYLTVPYWEHNHFDGANHPYTMTYD